MGHISEQTNEVLASGDAGSVICGGGRKVSFSEYGRANGIPVLWCHGAPGSRLDPRRFSKQAFEAGFRLIGIDRPGYGSSSPQPGRTIDGWLADGLAIADHLGLQRFHVVGVSAGGAYALAFAALHPERVLSVVACCSMTDIRYAPALELMNREAVRAVWEAPDRTRALEVAAAAYGPDGSKVMQVLPLAPSDLALFEDREILAAAPTTIGSWFAQGIVGYTDDRLAEREGWTRFDVATIQCPVIVLHGTADLIVDITHAQHIAKVVPGATLRIVEGRGHLSIMSEIVPALRDLSR